MAPNEIILHQNKTFEEFGVKSKERSTFPINQINKGRINYQEMAGLLSSVSETDVEAL